MNAPRLHSSGSSAPPPPPVPIRVNTVPGRSLSTPPCRASTAMHIHLSVAPFMRAKRSKQLTPRSQWNMRMPLSFLRRRRRGPHPHPHLPKAPYKINPSHPQQPSILQRVAILRDRSKQSHDEVLHLPGPPRRPERRRRVRGGAGGGLRFLLPRAAVAGVVLRHEAELLLPALRQAGGGLRDPRPLAQPRRRLLPAELQPRQRLRPLQGERPPEQPAQGMADAGVPDERRPPVLGARVGEARHLRPEPLQRARLLPDRPPPPRPAPRPRRPRLRRDLPRRRLLHAERHQGSDPAGYGVRAVRRVQPRRVRQQPALPALLLRRRRRLRLRRVPRPARRQALRQQDRVPGFLIVYVS